MNIYVVNRYKKRVLVVRRNTHEKKLNALLNAKASLAIEGMFLTTREEQLLMRRVNGEVKNNEFLALAMEIAKNV
ncbi:hypothetical protein [Paenibacillus sp. FSL H8-0537]|uniref:hypothetical protein n=1 Tax=Paenibacillus sp. FSL H8-0537 TaxID=2921399 RepID=UPI00310141AB